MAYNLKLPEERGEQLRMIAEREGKTVVDVITDHIRAKIEQGVIPADLPLVDVTKTETGVDISAPGFEGSVPASEVPTLTEALRDAESKFTPADIERRQKLIELIGALSGVGVKRMARGVKLVSPITGKEYPLAFGVASDLAGQIEREAK